MLALPLVIRQLAPGVSPSTMLHRLLPLLILAPLHLLAPSTAAAAPDDICVPTANPHPDWWTPNMSPAKREARWSGADVREATNGVRSARLRSVWSPQADTIYVEVRVSTDLSLDDEDAFVMAISDTAQQFPELLVEFHPLEDCPVWTDCDGDGIALDAGSITYTPGEPTNTSMSWGTPSSVNASLNFQISHPWIVVTKSGNKHTWTMSFAMHVPTDGAGDFVDRRIYGNAIAYDPGVTSGTYYELPLWCTSSSITTNDCLIYSGPSPGLPGDLPWPAMQDTWSSVEAGSCS
ncbi:MAG TPA: hypothetical protein VG755_24240 [Nannocystaceae bacterium]|nr:hypothetical protein [Nannocystaceae bacterium]